jgi:hypothetical protein
MGTWIVVGIAVVSSVLMSGQDGDRLVAVLVLNALALSMIFKPGWWTFWMPLGFWEQLAKDKAQADQQGPVVRLIGWLLLLGVLLLAIFH